MPVVTKAMSKILWEPSYFFIENIHELLSIFHGFEDFEACSSRVDYEQSLSFLGPSSKTPETREWPRAWLKARDGRGTKKERPFSSRAAPSFLASRGFAAQYSRGRALPLLNLKKKRDCSQSISRAEEWQILKLLSYSDILGGVTFIKNPADAFNKDNQGFW